MKYTLISAQNGKPGFSKPLQFSIVEGNNSNLIRRVMQSRLAIDDSNFSFWEETQSTGLFNFKWKPTSHYIFYERLSKHGFKQLVNHIEGHQALTTKDELFFNLKAHCERRQQNVFKYLPFTMAVDFNSECGKDKFDQICAVVTLFENNRHLSTSELNKLLYSL